LVEQPIRNRQVSGSSPLVGSSFSAFIHAGFTRCAILATGFVVCHLLAKFAAPHCFFKLLHGRRPGVCRINHNVVLLRGLNAACRKMLWITFGGTPNVYRFVGSSRRNECQPCHLSPNAGRIERFVRLSRFSAKLFLAPAKMYPSPRPSRFRVFVQYRAQRANDRNRPGTFVCLGFPDVGWPN
jgi:hypothetical protein